VVHTFSLLPCHVRRLPGDAIELMPIVLPMTLTSVQRRQLAAILLDGLDGLDEEQVPSRAELCLA
jgi:glycerol-3-phosphate responsive antiterminator